MGEKVVAAAAPASASATVVTSDLKVVVHPIVLLSVVDHFNRVAKDTKKRVVGMLLGGRFREGMRRVRAGGLKITTSRFGLCRSKRVIRMSKSRKPQKKVVAIVIIL